MDIKYFWQIAEFEFMNEDALMFFKNIKVYKLVISACLFIWRTK